MRRGIAIFGISVSLSTSFGHIHIPFLSFDALRYGEIQWDTARYSWIQARYVQIQLAAGYSGIRRDTVDLLQNG